jgi:hypothetical protein
MRLAAPIAILLLAAALLAGCGDSSSDGGSGTGEATTSTGAGSPPKGNGSGPVGASARSCPVDANGTEGLRATGISCGEAQRLAAGWQTDPRCASRADASRSSCKVGSYTCLAAATDRGLAVSCAQPGRSIAFIAKP